MDLYPKNPLLPNERMIMIYSNDNNTWLWIYAQERLHNEHCTCQNIDLIANPKDGG